MDLSDKLTIVFGIITVISLILNYIQYLKKQNLEKDLRSQLQGSYNTFCQMERQANEVLRLPTENFKVEIAFASAKSIHGSASSSAGHIVAFMREHLKIVPREEDPHRPDAQPLPKITKKLPNQTT